MQVASDPAASIAEPLLTVLDDIAQIVFGDTGRAARQLSVENGARDGFDP
jgi:hypothetical protein